MPKNAYPPAAVVAIITLERKFLVIKRSATVRSPNQFCFPGGMIEVGETPQTALVREMSEELNIDVTPLKSVWSSRTPKGTRLHWWTATSNQLDRIFPNPSEVASFQWLEMEEINKLEDVLVSNQKFFDAINAGQINPEELHS
jgi:8-oxo-dGTP pyrophosphatase MutT (NUDIX family)